MQLFFEYLEKKSKGLILCFSLFLVLFLGFLDYATGPDLSVFIFYLIPVFIGAWFIGSVAGIGLSILSALAWAFADRVYADTLIPYWNLTIEMCFFFIAVFILSALKNSLENEKQMARTDALTGAVNRRYFMDLAEMEINRMRRYGHPFTAVYMDVDNFKSLNDMQGHKAGDDLLRLVVKTIWNDTRLTDIVARLGGDEFMIILPETDFATSLSAINKIRARLDATVTENKLPVTFSFGMVTFHEPPRSVDHLMQLTDNLMYKGKNQGKNMIHHEIFAAKKQA